MSQPFWLVWRDERGKQRRHAPDFLVRLTGGRRLVLDSRPLELIGDRDRAAFARAATPRPVGWPTKGNLLIGSPLAIALAHRGAARMYLGIPGWRDDFDQSIAMARSFDPATRALIIMYKYVLGFMHGTLLPDQAVLTDTAEALQIAEHSGDNFTLGSCSTHSKTSPWSIWTLHKVRSASTCSRKLETWP